MPSNDTAAPFDIKFFSLKNPTHPRFISHYVPTSKAGLAVKPHEMFLWVDPNQDDRALLFLSTPPSALQVDRTIPQLMVVDISKVPKGGAVTELAEANWSDLYPGTNNLSTYPFDNSNTVDGCGPYDCNIFVHSMGVKPDGSVTYMALEAGHFLILDTSDIADNRIPEGTVLDLHDKLLTNPTNRPVWLQNPLDPTTVPNEQPNSLRGLAPALTFWECPPPLQKTAPTATRPSKYPRDI